MASLQCVGVWFWVLEVRRKMDALDEVSLCTCHALEESYPS